MRKIVLASTSKYQVGGTISSRRVPWAIIEEVDNVHKQLVVTGKHGQVFEIPFESVDSYFPPEK